MPRTTKKAYRSKLEQTFAKQHPLLPYEDTRLSYDVTHTYTPDFKLAPNVFVEVKGLFDSADRQKHLHIRKQHPMVTIIFVFSHPHLKLNNKSKRTYADWCLQHGFKWYHIDDTAQLAADPLYNTQMIDLRGGNDRRVGDRRIPITTTEPL